MKRKIRFFRLALPMVASFGYAAHFAMAEIGNLNASKFYLDLYEKFALSYSQFTRIGRASNPYGRS